MLHADFQFTATHVIRCCLSKDYFTLREISAEGDSEDINRAWENIKRMSKPQLKKLGVHEVKQHKPWFHEECLRFLHRRKQAKLRWLQDRNQSHVYNLNNVRREASRHFVKKKIYLKGKIDEQVTNSKMKIVRDLNRGISDFKKGYQPGTNIVKDEKGDLGTDFHIIFSRWRNHLSELLNVLGVNDVRQTEIHTAEALVPEPGAFEVEVAIVKPERHKSLGTDQIPAKLIKAGSKRIRS